MQLLAEMMWANVLEKKELAKEESKRYTALLARAAHWPRYDLGRLPDDAELWKRAAEVLKDAPEMAMVGVGPKPTTAVDEADKAAHGAAALQIR